MIHNLSYCGALIDGKGYIGIRKVKQKDRLEIRVQMKDESPIKFFADTFKISYIKHRYCKNLPYTNYLVVVSQNKAFNILQLVTPFLIGKKHIAEKLLIKYKNRHNKYSI
jgi:hypothetical protein